MSSSSRSTSLEEIVARTPPSRERYVDFLRALSITVVVIGHWLMASIYVNGPDIRIDNTLEAVSAVQYATWVLQVMPLFFFVGGFSNLVGWRAAIGRHQNYSEFLAARTRRLMKPTLVFVSAWLFLAATVELAFGDSGRRMIDATSLLAKPLWFLAVYVLVVALAPVMVRLHDRYRWGVPAALVSGVVVIDLLRLGLEIPFIGVLNFALVWLLPHQLGFFYADGTLRRLRPRAHLLIAFAGFASLVVLTSIGVYSRSMVGVVADRVSNNSPPSLCLIALAVWLIGLAMVLRSPAERWLSKRGPWTAVVACNTMIMTAFLWHLTAVVIVVAVTYPLGWPQPATGTGLWWSLRPAWIALLSLAIVPLIAVFGRYERTPLAKAGGVRRRPPLQTALGVVALVAGLAIYAQEGFSGWQLGALDGLAGAIVPALIMVGGYRLLVPTARALLPRSDLGTSASENGH